METNIKNKINVLFLAAEADPWMKVGGLGDVAYSLPNALRTLSNNHEFPNIDIRLVLPSHAAIKDKVKKSIRVARFSVPSINGPISSESFYTELNNIPVYIISGDPIPNNGPVYSGDNHIDGNKFIFFSLASMQMVKELNWKPDIIHANDWHTSLALYDLLLRKMNGDNFFEKTKSIISIHNLPFMGNGTEKELISYNIETTTNNNLPEWARHTPLPMGMMAADEIVAVSPKYAKEIQTLEFGCGLQEFIRKRKNTVSGIINGLDYDIWDPALDKNIAVNFSVNNLDERMKNKQYLLKEFSLNPDERIPLIIMVGRLDPQKGVDLAFEAFRQIVDIPWQVIILGTGTPKIEEDALNLQVNFPDRVRIALRFDAKLSRQMYAGGDILLMPSRYEPCGLAQMIAMKYGCVPVARATGGLVDTIVDIDKNTDGTGFLFNKISSTELSNTLRKAITYFNNDDLWKKIQLQGMKKDFSWRNSAISYINLYNKILGNTL